MADTYTRAQYLLAVRNQANMNAITKLAEDMTIKVLGNAGDLGQQAMGSYMRDTLPGIVDQYGNLNAVTAVQHYDASRLLAYQALGTQSKTNRRTADRIAKAQLESEIWQARLFTMDTVDKTDPVINYAMAAYQLGGRKPMLEAAKSAMTRAVASYNRDTILFNTALDPGAVRVQRIARPNACPFCSLMAFSSTKSGTSKLDVRTADYAIHFHRSCHCTLETLYVGNDTPIRPDYYDKLESEYKESGGDLNEWRRLRSEQSASAELVTSGT